MGNPAQTQEIEHKQDILAEFANYMQDEMVQVYNVMLAKMHSKVYLIQELADYLVSAGGKRLRPLLTLACARMFGYQGSKHIDLAASIEFIHTATLLHDDVVDNSDIRRGKDTANIVWGNQASVLVGDFLFSRAFQLMTDAGNIKVLSLLSNASAMIAEGEVMQLTNSYSLDISEQQYYQVVNSKTATLFSAACTVGSMITNQDKNIQQSLAQFGTNLGMCFQIIDDILDYTSNADELGKNIGDDLKEHKVTLPLIHAYHTGSDQHKAKLRDILAKGDITHDDLAHVIDIMMVNSSITYAKTKAIEFGNQAKYALTNVPESVIKQYLLGMVNFCLCRAV